MVPVPRRFPSATLAVGILVAGSLALTAPASATQASATQASATQVAATQTSATQASDRRHGDLLQHEPLRVATFNASLNRAAAGQLLADLSTPDNAQARTIAEIVQRSETDVILLNEFDYPSAGSGTGSGTEAVDLFRDNYLEVSQNGAAPVDYPYAYVAPSNTGVPSGFDLNNAHWRLPLPEQRPSPRLGRRTGAGLRSLAARRRGRCAR